MSRGRIETDGASVLGTGLEFMFKGLAKETSQ